MKGSYERPWPLVIIFLLSPFLIWGNIRTASAETATAIPFRLQQRSLEKDFSPAELTEAVECLIFLQTQKVRTQKQLPQFEQEGILQEAARDHSQDMLRRRYFSHFSPEGQSVADRVRSHDRTPRSSIGENLHTISSSRGLHDPEAIANQMLLDWMNSPGHRRNIVSQKYHALGVGCASDGKRIYCTQVFSGPYLR